MEVLVVSTTGWWAEWLLGALTTAGWSTATCDRAAVVAVAGEHHPGLVVFEAGGAPVTVEVVERLHRNGARVVALSANRTEGQLESTLAAGADGFIQLPVGTHELVARLRAVLRRPAIRVAAADLTALRAGDLVLRRDAPIAEVRDVELALSRRERAVLERLLVAAPLVVGRDELGRALLSADPAPANLDVVVRRLRTRLEAVEAWRRIESVRGVGFRLLVDDRRPAFTLATGQGHGAFPAPREPSGL
jgi:DNA-binding response OmpR family regulator